jgi:hypothetical protein
MSNAVAVLVVLFFGAALTFGAIRATSSVQHGRTFLRWMLVVFVAYLAMISLPVAMAL